MKSPGLVVYEDVRVRAGLRLYVELTEKYLLDMSALMSGLYGAVPAFAPLLGGLSADALARQNGANLARVRKAAFDGDWEPYLENLRARGVAYAQAGVDFATWTAIFQRALLWYVDLSFRELGHDPERLAELLMGTTAIFDTVVSTIGETYLATHVEKIRSQREHVRAISVPVLALEERTLLVPLVGEVDDERASMLKTRLLSRVAAERARVVVVDVTGVPSIDQNSASHLVDCAKACQLMGARVMLSGMSSETCRTLVLSGIDLGSIRAFGTLQEALAVAFRPPA